MRSNGASRKLVEAELSKAVQKAFEMPIAPSSSREMPPISTIASLNTRWHMEPNYVDRSGKPKPLTWNGRQGTLLKLAQQVLGKEKAPSAVRDLVRRKLLFRTRDSKWLPKAQVLRPGGLDRPQVIRTAAMIERLLRTVSYNSKREYKGNDLLFEVMTRVPRLPATELAEFKRFARSQGMVYVRSVDDWLESKNLRKKKRKARNVREAGVVVFAYDEPSADP
jgi:hypothetical protein